MSPQGRNWDDVGALLRALGPGYQYTQISLDDLLEPDQLAKYDVVFLPCSPVPKTWVVRRVHTGVRDNTAVFAARPEIVARLKKSLRHFVTGGGTLYASDWQFDLLGIAFPEMVDEAKVMAWPSATVRLAGFSTYTCLPAWQARTVCKACQWSGVVVVTAKGRWR